MLSWDCAPGEAQMATVALLEGVDLDVTFINRTPLYKAYCVQYMYDVPDQPGRPFLCPGTENDRRWPEPGEVVTFTAHIVNKGTAASPAFGYAWHIDGAEVAHGTLPVAGPGGRDHRDLPVALGAWPVGRRPAGAGRAHGAFHRRPRRCHRRNV